MAFPWEQSGKRRIGGRVEEAPIFRPLGSQRLCRRRRRLAAGSCWKEAAAFFRFSAAAMRREGGVEVDDVGEASSSPILFYFSFLSLLSVRSSPVGWVVGLVMHVCGRAFLPYRVEEVGGDGNGEMDRGGDLCRRRRRCRNFHMPEKKKD